MLLVYFFSRCLVLSISDRMRWESRKCDALLMEDSVVPCQHFAAGRLLAAEVVRQVLRMRSCSGLCVASGGPDVNLSSPFHPAVE